MFFFIIFSIVFPPHFNYNCTALQNMNYYCVNNKQQNVKRKFHQISIKTCRELDWKHWLTLTSLNSKYHPKKISLSFLFEKQTEKHVFNHVPLVFIMSRKSPKFCYFSIQKTTLRPQTKSAGDSLSKNKYPEEIFS